MPDIKFSCPQCGQHISCDEAWSGHEIQCPACQNHISVPNLAVPQVQAPAASPAAPPASGRPKLSAGATQVTRPTPAAPLPSKRITARPPKTTNPAIKYAIVAVLLVVVGVAALIYLP